MGDTKRIDDGGPAFPAFINEEHDGGSVRVLNDVLRALAALETATRHDPRPVPRCDVCGHEFMLRYVKVEDGHRSGQRLCDHCYRKHANPCGKSMTVELSNGIPLVRLGQGDYTRDFTPQAISAPGGETKDRAQVTEG